MEKIIQEIIRLEWTAFLQSEARILCQDAGGMFASARVCQLNAWSREMLECHRNDLLSQSTQSSAKRGTAETVSPPACTLEKEWLIDWICQARGAWHGDLRQRFPCLSAYLRPPCRQPGYDGAPPFEICLRKELEAYSIFTLRLYAAYVERLQKEGRNLNEMILKNTMEQYGFADLETAEQTLAQGA